MGRQPVILRIVRICGVVVWLDRHGVQPTVRGRRPGLGDPFLTPRAGETSGLH